MYFVEASKHPFNRQRLLKGDLLMTTVRITRALAVLAFALSAAVAARAMEPAKPAAPGAPAAAAPGAVCGSPAATSWSAPAGAIPVLTLLCGSCSEGTCPGRNINTACVDNFGFAGRCGAELTKCSDGHNFCTCQSEPQPGH
jgi:hypothetical protein